MGKKPEVEPRIVVTQQVRIELSREEVDHALRCWVDQSLSDSLRPKPKNFSDIRMEAVCSTEGDLLGYTAIYEPAERK